MGEKEATLWFETFQMSRKPPSSTPGGDRHICAQRLFCRECNSEQLLFEAFFDIVGNFGRVEP